jgi:hypothetical protein
MATPEEAISIAVGSSMDPEKILAWTNHSSTGQLEIIYDGPFGISSISIASVLIIDAHAGE